ncbi:MAG: alkaline phosphatase family protein [Actinomycetota bacterium]|nr:alkaline phosphatase family protein [Actinomycetota bacterium]
MTDRYLIRERNLEVGNTALRPPKRSTRFVALSIVGLVAIVGFVLNRGGSDPNPPTVATLDPVKRFCGLDEIFLERLRRGHHPVRSEDITLVPKEPNFVGTFDVTSHSGPWDYIQNIPLVLYGPGVIEPAGVVEAEADLADIYPTIGRLLGLDLPPADGQVLAEGVPTRPPTAPKLVVVIVWDGAGRKTLERWPDAWPHLADMEQNGVSYVNASVGSSPAVTSVAHSTLATGTWPNKHGIAGNELRAANGLLRPTFADLATDQLKRPTFSDLVDNRFGNASQVGLLAWTRWHVGLLSHGTAYPGGDADQMAMMHYNGEVLVHGNERLFEVPEEIEKAASIDDLIHSLDREDGAVDGEWLGNEISLPSGAAPWTEYSNPAWAEYQTELALKMLENGAYGQDEIPDLFLANFKMTDLAGHRWGIESKETEAMVEAQDESLGSIVRYLDENVGEYVVVVTADHGASPLPESTGAWPISQGELIRDVDAHFEVPNDKSLVESTATFGIYLNRDLAKSLKVSAGDVARFLNGYTIAQNWAESELPDGYEGRGDELVMSAAFPSDTIDNMGAC